MPASSLSMLVLGTGADGTVFPTISTWGTKAALMRSTL